jgi:hypothetical protein
MIKDLSAYLHTTWQAAHGKAVESVQFNFTQQQLDYLDSNYIHLDHEGRKLYAPALTSIHA